MKSILFIGLISLFLSGSSTNLDWDSMLHDFEQIQARTEVTHDFIYTNNTDEPIIIEAVRTSCSCTASEWTEEPILPGESGSIKIFFASSKPTYFYKKIMVFTSAQKKATILAVTGVVVD